MNFITISKIVGALILFVSYFNMASADSHVLIPKFGFTDWQQNKGHSINNSNFDLNESNSAAIGMSYRYRMDNGIALGADAFVYKKSIVETPSNSGSLYAQHIYATAEKGFDTGVGIRPYIGAGLGIVNLRFSNVNVNGNNINLAEGAAYSTSFEYYLGVEFETNDDMSFLIEFKHYYVKMDDVTDNKDIYINSGGNAIFVGAVFRL